MPLRLVLLWLLCLPLLPVSAQLCQGRFSDPTVVIDFGSQAAPYPMTGKFGAQYGSTTEVCTPEGTIGLRPQAFMCKDDWQVTPFDHTDGDQNGNFLMVSALPGDTEVYRDTLTGLCPNTIFQAEFWVLNLTIAAACNGQPREPRLKVELFSNTGTLIGTLNTGTIPVATRAEWQSFRFQFRSPLSGGVVMRVTSLDARVCGSDFGLDDISFAPCKGEVSVRLPGMASQTVQVCQDQQQEYLLQSRYDGFVNPSLQWQVRENGSTWQDVAGANNPQLRRQPSDAGEYAYRLRLRENGDAACTFVSNAVQLQINRKPFAQGTNYVYGCYGFPANFQASGGTAYEWSGPSGFRSTAQAPTIPRLDFVNAGRYIVKVSNTAGCVAYDSTDLVVYEAPKARLNIRDTLLCAGDSIRLEASGASRYLWQPSAGLSNDTLGSLWAKPATNTRYTVRVYNEFTCYDTASVSIRVYPKPFVDAGPDKFLLKNRSATLEGRVTGQGVRFRWTPADGLSNPNVQRPTVKATQTTLYVLEATGEQGCGRQTDTMKVEVLNQLLVPTAFTPNGDRLNDQWEIVAFENYPKATVAVYNRWGVQVYGSDARNYKPWDGRYKNLPVVPGIYIYLLNLGDGSPLRKGSLTVLQ